MYRLRGCLLNGKVGSEKEEQSMKAKQGMEYKYTNRSKYLDYISFHGDKNDIWNRKEESG